MKIAIIAAIADNNAIGINNTMPWHLPEDLRHFKSVTMGKPIIMGHRTFNSLKRPLPGRTNIVVTRGHTDLHKEVTIAKSIEEAITIAKQVATTNNTEEIIIMGGANIYEQTLHLADKLYLTRIHKSFEADTFFPEIDMRQWNEIFREEHVAEKDKTLKYAFTILEAT